MAAGPLSGFGTPTIDGAFSPGEWDGAAQIPVFSGTFSGSIFYVMNDQNHLYLALRVPDPSLGPNDVLKVRFDNAHNAAPNDGDDELCPTAVQFRDCHFSFAASSWGFQDSQQDGASAAGNTGSFNFFEVSHPLTSGDPDDFSLSVGATVGFCLRYFRDGVAFGASAFPAGCEGAANAQHLYGDIVIASSVVRTDIDIKPGSDPNSVNCTNNRGVIRVAILTTSDFDALTVDHGTVTFEGATETHVDQKTGAPRRHEEDVDGDGDIDLVFHFRLGDTGLDCASTEGTLSGETFDGQAIEGTDAVRMVDVPQPTP